MAANNKGTTGASAHHPIVLDDDSDNDDSTAKASALMSQETHSNEKNGPAFEVSIIHTDMRTSTANNSTGTSFSNKRSAAALTNDEQEEDWKRIRRERLASLQSSTRPPLPAASTSSESVDDDNDRDLRAALAMSLQGESSKNSSCVQPSRSIQGIKLFASKQDAVQAQGNRLGTTTTSTTSSREQLGQHCLTLREMLGFDGNSYNNDSPTWMVIANFLIDFDYLLDHVPELLTLKQAVVFYGCNQGTSTEPWHRACTRPDGTCAVDFCPLVPSDPPGPTNPLKRKIDYGVHHSKIFLIGLASGKLRVIVHTANLLFGDNHVKAQGAYIQDFPRKKKSASTGDCAPCEFETSLIKYLETYGYTKRHDWEGNNETEAKLTMMEQLRLYDFSSASVILIPSTPGYHGLNTNEGLLGLRNAIHTTTRTDGENTATCFGPVVCQFSSIGSLSHKWLQQQFLAASRGERPTNAHSFKKMSLQDKLRLVYPTVEEIRTSVEGYRGGGSVPGRKKNVDKDFLRNLFCKWRSSATSNPVHKGQAVPHIKTYFQLDSPNTFQWFVLTSHNMSKSAWGEIRTNQYGTSLFVRSWELGVFVSPQLLSSKAPAAPNQEAATSAVAAAGGKPSCRLVAAGTGEAPQEGDVIIPLPYSVNPSHYCSSDEPWACDQEYNIPDAFGLSMA